MRKRFSLFQFAIHPIQDASVFLYRPVAHALLHESGELQALLQVRILQQVENDI